MRYFLEVMYDGTAFHGSQIQENAHTVQAEVNKALGMILREDVHSFGASRTDEGVHALCNMYHFDTEKSLPQDFLYKLNSIFPQTLTAKELYLPEDQELNARFHAIRRQYRYCIYRQKNPFLYHKALFFPVLLDDSLLHQTAEILLGITDFTSFAKRNAQTKTNICQLYTSRWERHGDELQYVVQGNRFLRGMVRGLVATQLNVARGKCSLDDFHKIISAHDNAVADFNVAGYGLYLEKIEYTENALQKWHGI